MQMGMLKPLIALALAIGVSAVGIQPVISPTCPGANAGPQSAQSTTADCISSLDNVSVGTQINSSVANSQTQSQTSAGVNANTQTNAAPNTPGVQVAVLNSAAKTAGMRRSDVIANIKNEIGSILNRGINLQPKASIHVDADTAASANPDLKMPADRAGERDVEVGLRATLFGPIK